MIQRTVSGKVIEKPAAPPRPERKQWEARDEWRQPIVASGEPTDEFPNWKIFRAVDGTAAAELAAAHLVDRYELEGPTTIYVRCLPNGDWVGVRIDVSFTVEVEISARGLAPTLTPRKLRRAKR